MKSYRAYNIEYDTEGYKIDGLPQELIIELEDDQDPVYDLADKISDQTGFSIYGLHFEEVKP